MPEPKLTFSIGKLDTSGAGLSSTGCILPWDPNPFMRHDELFPVWDYDLHADPRRQTGWTGYEIAINIFIPGDSGSGDSTESALSYIICLNLLAQLPEEGRREAIGLLSAMCNKYQAEIKPAPTIEQTFYCHLVNWLHDIASSSDPNVIFSHPSYRAIVGMGPSAIPFLRRELDKHSLPLSCAYDEIAGQAPNSTELVASQHGFLGTIRKVLRW